MQQSFEEAGEADILVIRNVDQKGVLTIAREMGEPSAAARAGAEACRHLRRMFTERRGNRRRLLCAYYRRPRSRDSRRFQARPETDENKKDVLLYSLRRLCDTSKLRTGDVSKSGHFTKPAALYRTYTAIPTCSSFERVAGWGVATRPFRVNGSSA